MASSAPPATCATPLCSGEVKILLGLCGHVLCHTCAHRAYDMDKCPVCFSEIATVVFGSMEPRELLEAIHIVSKEVFSEENKK